ncbi:MBL fold metallo-hydrolase [Candidatus Uhrbacteria bacterium]|nr:MBL fold metallo-hydrolase [Candidatus Uhrbacteria bacterium]
MQRAKPRHPIISSDKLQVTGLVCIVMFFSFAHWAISSAQVFPWQTPLLKIWTLDVGQGDALFIEFPTGEQMLIDGGPDDTVLTKLGSVMAPWDRTLDAVLVTHPDADHVTGTVAVLDRFDVATIYESGIGAHTPFGEAYEVAKVDKVVKVVEQGDVIQVGDVTLKILWPQVTQEGRYAENRNNFSVVFLLTYGKTSVLFTGDAEKDPEHIFGPLAGDVDVLKVGHHGSLSSTSWELLQEIDPEIALIGVGQDNSYGHPHPVILDRLSQIGAAVYRTDLDGDILLTSSGGEPTVVARPLPF